MFEISKNNVNPKIISSTFIDGRTYFEIEYFDKEKNESCVGFGSFERSNCEQWLKEYFMEIKCENSYGIPVYSGITTVTNKKPTWKDNIKYLFRMTKFYLKRMLHLLK